MPPSMFSLDYHIAELDRLASERVRKLRGADLTVVDARRHGRPTPWRELISLLHDLGSKSRLVAH
jgi:hypothetical protein